jgi:hypothetical protein
VSPLWVVITMASGIGSACLFLIFFFGLLGEVRRPRGKDVAADDAPHGNSMLHEPKESEVNPVYVPPQSPQTRDIGPLKMAMLRDVSRDPDLRRVVLGLWRELATARRDERR